MKIVFLGATQFSRELFLHLLDNKLKIDRLYTIPQEFKISYSDTKVKNYNFSNLQEIAEAHHIPCFEVDSVRGKRMHDYYEDLTALQPDIILVMGWYYMVPPKIRNTAKYGAWAIHASLLPRYAGGAPLVWAIINGEKETGVTLFRLADGVDDGDIIAQQKIPIEFEDTIKEVYAKATVASKKILLDALENIGTIQFTEQDKLIVDRWPQRKPEDGEIDQRWPAEKIYNFIRAQAPPYPGAFIRTTDGKKIIIEKARFE